eukprot:11667325-Alexandrium_andersonii.AAC.1
MQVRAREGESAALPDDPPRQRARAQCSPSVMPGADPGTAHPIQGDASALRPSQPKSPVYTGALAPAVDPFFGEAPIPWHDGHVQESCVEL